MTMLTVRDSKLLQDIEWLSLNSKRALRNGRLSILSEDKVFISYCNAKETWNKRINVYIGKTVCHLLEINIDDVLVPSINNEKQLLRIFKNHENKLGFKLCKYNSIANLVAVSTSKLNFEKPFEEYLGMKEAQFELFSDHSIVLSLENILKKENELQLI
jgi:hypothetical protein